MFRKGFENNVKNKLLCYKKIIDSIKTLIRVIIKVNNKLYKRAIKKKFNDLRKRVEIYISYLTYKQEILRKSTKNNRFKDLNYIGLILIKLNFT